MEIQGNYGHLIETLSTDFSEKEIITLVLQLFAWKKVSNEGSISSTYSFDTFYHSEITWKRLNEYFQQLRDNLDSNAFRPLSLRNTGNNLLQLGVNSIYETDYPGYLAITELIYNTIKQNKDEYAIYNCKSLFKFLSALIKQNNGDNIYELFPGDFALHYSLLNENDIPGYTEGSGYEQIPSLLRILEGLSIEHIQTDPIEKSPGYTVESASHILKQFDSAVVNLLTVKEVPKVNIDVDPYNRFFFSDSQNLTIYSYIEHCLAHTSGRLYVIVPNKFLSRTISTEKQFKQALTKRGIIEAVITLPQNIFPIASISASLIVFNTKGSTERDVFFVDASSEQFYRKEGRKNAIEPAKLVSLIQSKTKMESISRNVTPQEIHDNHYSLIPQHYSLDSRYRKVDKTLSSFKKEGMLLDEIFEVIHPRYPSLEPEEDAAAVNVKYVTPKDIPEHGLIQTTQERQVKRSIITKGNYQLEANDILLSIKGKVGLVGIIPDDLGKDYWICARQFIALRVTSEKFFSPKALYMYLNSDVIQLLFEKISVGTNLRVLQLKDILSIPVPIERKEEFENNFNEANRLYIQLEEIQSEIERIFKIT